MKKKGATVYWIELTSFTIQTKTIMEYELKGGATYASEALWNIPDNAPHEVIRFEQEGSDFAKMCIERLKAEADKLRIQAQVQA